MSVQIALEEMKFYAYHGVLPQERKVGNHFVVFLQITVPVEASLHSDCLEDTVNYAFLYELVKKEMETPSRLLEHVAGRISRSVRQAVPGLQAITLKVSKINPPFGGDVRSASVTLSESYG